MIEINILNIQINLKMQNTLLLLIIPILQVWAKNGKKQLGKIFMLFYQIRIKMKKMILYLVTWSI